MSLGPPRPAPSSFHGDEEPAPFLATMDPISGPLRWLTRSATFEAFRFREFRYLWLGQLGSSMGQWMDQVTRGWLMYDLTGSALQLGLVSAVRFFPILLLSPLAGTAAD